MKRNKTIEKNGWTISFLPSQNLTVNSLVPKLAAQVALDESETAIFSSGEPRTPMLILKGNWSGLYDQCDTYEEALSLYENNKGTHRSVWSED